jgi:carbon monoxide dehydrogenase subunit G
MELEHSFSVPVPVERAWDVLLDVERVAPCMPGASLDSVDGDSITGKIKVKVGPIQMTYAGTAKFTQRDKEAGVVTLEASGRETRGAGTASASVRSELKADGDQTDVVVHTTLNVTGKPAQFGRGVMVEVGGRLIGIFADNLAAMLAAEPPAGREPGAEGTPAADEHSAGDAGVPATSTGDEALPIDVLNLSSRAWGSLRQDGIQTLGDLIRRTDQQLLALDHIGPASLADVRSKLADRGLRLADSADAAGPGSGGPDAAGSDAAGTEPAGTTPAAATPAPAADANGVRAAAGKHAGAGEDLAQVTPLRPARHESPDVPAARGTTPREAAQPEQSSWRPPETDAIDLLDIAGLPVLKRAVPAAAAVLAVILVLLGIRRRRRSRRS